MKPFLLLSKHSPALITQCLQRSETSPPFSLPKLYINRQLAREHRARPALDPGGKNTVFTQVRWHPGGRLPRQHCSASLRLSPLSSWCFAAGVQKPAKILREDQGALGLQVGFQLCLSGCHLPGAGCGRRGCQVLQEGVCTGLSLSHRWPQSYSQWWACDFTTEGIIDHGESSPVPPRGSLGGPCCGGCCAGGSPALHTRGAPCIPLPPGVGWGDPAAPLSHTNQPLPPLQAVVFGTACRTSRRSCVPARVTSPCPCPSSCAHPTRSGTPGTPHTQRALGRGWCS